jgi:UDP-glucuronate 4-epimerase
MEKSTILVTGAAGFIGYFLSKRLLEKGHIVIGIDNLNDYYDVSLKQARLDLLLPFKTFTFYKIDISNKEELNKIFDAYHFDYVVNLAAQAGVRYSIENPDVYIQSNIIGFYNILESCRHHPVKHLVYASSSSVYGANKKVPFEETDNVDHPVSLYAATKKSNELMADTYSHLYKIPATGLRFFTVYGPMGRPDMAYFSFTESYFKGKPIQIFNNGDFDHDLYRDFTYIDDIVQGIANVIIKLPEGQDTPHRILNIGNNNPIKLMEFVYALEKSLSKTLGKKIEFKKEYLPMKPGDVSQTYASIDKLEKLTKFKPTITLEEGLNNFAYWYVLNYRNQLRK